MNRSLRASRGYSMLELTIVLAVILLLASLFAPALRQARDRAKGTSCASNLNQVGVALHLYAADHDGWFPPGPGDLGLSAEYAKNLGIFHCPLDGRTPASSSLPLEGAVPELYSTSYLYQPGLADDDAPQNQLAWDDLPRHGGRLAVRLDGAVIGLSSPRTTLEPTP